HRGGAAGGLRPPEAARDRPGRTAGRRRPARAPRGADLRLGDALRSRLLPRHPGDQGRAGAERALAPRRRVRARDRARSRRRLLRPAARRAGGRSARRPPRARGAGGLPVSRLWDKGAPLDARVLAYTAGEDHALDDRLVAYDVRASLAHAEMLAARGLLAVEDLGAVRAGLEALAAEHARGLWKVELVDEDVHTALER